MLIRARILMGDKVFANFQVSKDSMESGMSKSHTHIIKRIKYYFATNMVFSTSNPKKFQKKLAVDYYKFSDYNTCGCNRVFETSA